MAADKRDFAPYFPLWSPLAKECHFSTYHHFYYLTSPSHFTEAGPRACLVCTCLSSWTRGIGRKCYCPFMGSQCPSPMPCQHDMAHRRHHDVRTMSELSTHCLTSYAARSVSERPCSVLQQMPRKGHRLQVSGVLRKPLFSQVGVALVWYLSCCDSASIGPSPTPFLPVACWPSYHMLC